MRQRVFISRDISKERRQAYEEKFSIELLPLSLISFDACPKVTLPDFEMVFFYSKTAVHYFIQTYGLHYLKGKKTGTLGFSAKKELKKAGVEADFCGDGDPQSVQVALSKYAANQRVLFPRAKISKRSLQGEDKNYTCIDCIAYNNYIPSDITIPEADIYLFTSPLNVQSYLKNKGRKNTITLAIGKTTEKELLSSGFNKVYRSETSSESDIIEKAVTILNQTKH